MRVLLSSAFFLALSGCAFGPKYQRPDINPPGAFRGPSTPTTEAAAASLGDAQWWTVFQDEELQKLIRTALVENLDVRIAAARVDQAMAQVGVTRTDQLPTITANGSAGRLRNPSNPVIPSFETNLSQLGPAAVWQLDFWGKYRKATEAARAELAASEWGQKAIIATLVANVASSYFQLRELDLELEISQRTLAARRESLDLNRTLEEGGAVSRIDVHQAEILVEQAASAIPDLERRIAQQENLISILLGKNPGEVARGMTLTQQPLLLEIPAGLPSSLLERRPDIREAEMRLVAANARIGVAKAAYFPQVTLTGNAGVQAYSFDGLFSSTVYNVGVNVSQPLFDLARIRNNVRLTEAQKEEMIATYIQAVQQAFREVSDALIANEKNHEYRERQDALRTAAQQATDLSNIRYQGGATSYLEVLQSSTNLYEAEIGLAQSQLNERLAVVQIYNALGGGWQ